MRLDRLITLGVVQPIGRAFGRFPAFDAPPSETRRTLPVLMYHSISDDPEPAFSPYYKVCTSPARFAEHMQWLAEAGWQGVTLSEGLAALRKEESNKNQVPGKEADSNKGMSPVGKNPKPIAITFDDGFRDFHTAAFPVLERQGFAATMYVPTAFIGDSRKKFKDRECLTWTEIEELRHAGMEFGSHTVNHPVLVKLDWSEIEMELRDSKSTLEQRLQSKAVAFAYPFAYPQENRDYCVRLAAILRKVGYESCVTTRIGRVRTVDNPFTLKRLPANSCDDRSFLSAKTGGAYDWLGVPQALSRSAKRRKNRAVAQSPVYPA